MAENTNIEWADDTANLWKGCSKVSAGCDNCYAAELVGTCGSRFKDTEWGPHGERKYVKAGWATLRKRQREHARNGGVCPTLKRRRRIFINSLSDFFDNHRSILWRDEGWQAIREASHLIIILVTKRPQNIAGMLPPFWDEIRDRVCILVSTENQVEYNRRVLALFDAFTPENRPLVFGISAEPLLDHLALSAIPYKNGWFYDALEGTLWRPNEIDRRKQGFALQWGVFGGESGSKWRAALEVYFESALNQCDDAGVAYFQKQMPGKKPIPEHLMVRQFPKEFDL